MSETRGTSHAARGMADTTPPVTTDERSNMRHTVNTSKGPVRFHSVGEPITEVVSGEPAASRRASLHIATRNVLTGYLSDITPVGDDLGYARRAAQERADTLLTGSVWLTTGHPCDQYSAVLEAFPATRV